MLRAFTLFHASQIDGIPPYVAPGVEQAPWRAPEATDIIVAKNGVVLRIGGERAFYSPSTDHVQMPPQTAFRSPAAWSSVLLHERVRHQVPNTVLIAISPAGSAPKATRARSSAAELPG